MDAYIATAAEFARPILEHIRETVHAAHPDIRETIKWGRPHFEHHGIVCGMAAFRSHCSLSFWKAALIPGVGPNSANGGEGMGNFGRITSIEDLPSKRVLIGYMREAIRLNEEKRSIQQRG